jgi:hypothetical protein
MRDTPNPYDALRQEISALLESEHGPQANGVLLRQMEELARRPGFESCADLWAPALYARDPSIFRTFLLRHLDDDESEVISSLLVRSEADGQDALFTGLYRRVTSGQEWNEELRALANSPLTDDELERAVGRRNMNRGDETTLSDDTAVALYRRAPDLFTPFIQAHVRRHWREKGVVFPEVRAEAMRRGDDDFYWRLFRKLASPEEWQEELNHLLAQHVPAEVINEELRRRHAESADGVNAPILAAFLQQYGAAVLPYLEQNLPDISRQLAARLTETAQQLGDENLYWRLFFRVPDITGWNKALRVLLAQPLDDEALAQELRRCTPPPERRTMHLASDVAEGLYARNPARFRPFIQEWLERASVPLFQAAEARLDEDFLDYLTTQFLRSLVRLIAVASPYGAAAQYSRPDPKAQQLVAEIGQMVCDRFDRLHASAPERYVHHASSILSQCEDEVIGSIKRSVVLNPVFAYLYTRHRADWLRLPAAIGELLESPADMVRLVGLTFLEAGGPDAARCAAAHIPLLRAILLDRSTRGAKKRALAALRLVAQHDPTAARQVLPLLEDALHYQAKDAIDERVMVSYVRLRARRAAAV